MNEINNSLFQKLMSDPIKRQLVLEVINSEKDQIQNYLSRNDSIADSSTRIHRKNHDSPVALLRQRALKQKNIDSKENAGSSCSTSDVQICSTSTPVTCNKILEGVIAFVEVKNHDQDRSRGVKALMKAMGSDVRDIFSKDVTHVIFKEGSYKTYQKARLMNIHLVSVLWIEACKLKGRKVPENKFPALGVEAYEHNASTICSQLQKEYEDIIKDELNKSFTLGKPLPSTKDLMTRRKSLMTSNISNKFSQKFSSPDVKEQLKITRGSTNSYCEKKDISEMSSDDSSDVDAIIDGNIISKSNDQIILESFVNETCNRSINMEITNLESQHTFTGKNDEVNLITDTNLDSTVNFYNVKTPKLKKIDNVSVHTPQSGGDGRKTQLLQSSDCNCISIFSKNISKCSPALSQNQNIEINQIDKKLQTTNIQSLKTFCATNMTTEATISNLENDRRQCKTSNNHFTNGNLSSNNNTEKSSYADVSKVSSEINQHNTANVELNIENIKPQHYVFPSNSDTSNKTENSISTNMCSLHISSDINRNNLDELNAEKHNFQNQTVCPTNAALLDNNIIEKSSSTDMSPLQISSSRSKNHINILSVISCKPQAKSSTIPIDAETSDKSNFEKSVSTNMSSLHISSDTSSNNKICAVRNTRNSNDQLKTSTSISKTDSLNDEKTSTINKLTLKRDLASGKDKPEHHDILVKTICGPESEDKVNKKIRNNRSLTKTKPNEEMINVARSISIHNFKQNKLCNEENNVNSFESDNSFSPLKPINLNNIFKTLNSSSPSKRDHYITKRHKNYKSVDAKSNSDEDTGTKKKSKKDENCDNTKEALVTQYQEKKTLRRSSRTSKSNSLEKIPSVDKFIKNYSNSSMNTHQQTKNTKSVKTSTNCNQMLDSSTDSCCSENIKNKKTYRSTIKLRSSSKNGISKKNQNEINLFTDESSSSSDKSSTKKKRIRKLYNPNESFSRQSTVDDDTERGIRRVKTKLQKHTTVIVVPDMIQTKSNLILSDKTKNFLEINNMNIENILNKEMDENNDNIPTIINKKRKKNEVTQIVDNGADEQKELTEKILNEQNMDNFKKRNERETIGQHVRRRSTRLSRKNFTNTSFNSIKGKSPKRVIKKQVTPQTTGKIVKQKTLKKSAFNSNSQPDLNISTTLINRRSTMEFQNNIELTRKRKLKIDKVKESSIVCTKLHNDDVRVFEQIVKKIGGFFIEDEVTDRTTHLVVGETKRTINMLRAIARGCWILKHEWILKSLEAGKWLAEEDFEVTNFSQAVQQCRLQRQAFGASYAMDIFKDCGQIYVARGSIPRCSDLRELIILCNGKVTSILRNAMIIIGGFIQQEEVICLKETWVLDSIQNNKKMKFQKYIITADNNVAL